MRKIKPRAPGMSDAHLRRAHRFVEEYLKDLKPAEAIRRCGYEGEYAHNIAAKLLSYPWVKDMVDSAIARRSKRVEMTQDDVVRLLVTTIHDARAAGQHSAALRGLELVGRHLGMFRDAVAPADRPPIEGQVVANELDVARRIAFALHEGFRLLEDQGSQSVTDVDGQPSTPRH